MTMEEYDIRLKAQGGACAVCRRAPAVDELLHVDHDHVTGKIRDLLCFGCNAGLGNMNDNPKLLRIAADYLDFHAQRQKVTA